jgi:hypothetical protein
MADGNFGQGTASVSALSQTVEDLMRGAITRTSHNSVVFVDVNVLCEICGFAASVQRDNVQFHPGSLKERLNMCAPFAHSASWSGVGIDENIGSFPKLRLPVSSGEDMGSKCLWFQTPGVLLAFGKCKNPLLQVERRL